MNTEQILTARAAREIAMNKSQYDPQYNEIMNMISKRAKDGYFSLKIESEDEMHEHIIQTLLNLGYDVNIELEYSSIITVVKW